ncbi:META domain-containing protein [Corynebacterium alimapuense]|uniref:META domain-containing protein n=1 Tax=Corynebacterium alimapuense TaxID=1576874 RepID=A0A3M8K957_9CORY|nr:META domain-containing protein [Corynebacterium alimapuense]
MGILTAVSCVGLALSACSSSSAAVVVAGTWGEDAQGQPQLVLEEDGHLSGTDGCNRLAGSWEQNDEQTITFDQVAMTKMACFDVDTWLMSLDTAFVDGDVMHVNDASGAEIGSLLRAAQ